MLFVYCYHVPVTALPVPVTVLGYQGKFYSFGTTIRSFESIWQEVKDKLDTLEVCDFTEQDQDDIAPFLIRMIDA